MKKLFRFTLLLCFTLGLNITAIKSQTTFASEDELKKQAATLFDNDQFEEAYPLYSQLVSLYQKDVNYNYRLGVCMLFASDDKEKPIAFLEFAVNKPDVEKEALFYLARAYHLNYRFDDAIKKYIEYKNVASAAKAEKLMVDRQIEMCKNGKKLLRNITDLIVLDKKEMSRADFFRSYDISDIGGKLLVKPDEPAFKSAADKKKKENSIIYLATNNNQVYFSSYGEDPERGKDIYIIKKLPNGEWSKPQTLGYPVNTEYDEDYPFLHPNGKVLYFCSKGHNSMGGYDIFKTTLNEETNTWNKPVNMDFPINTPDDDILYVTNESEQEAFFSSARNSVTGKTAVFHINVERKPIDVAIIKGAVVANRDGQALDVRITVKDLGDNSMLGIYNSKESGSYIINLPNGGKFLYTVEAAGFKTQSEVVVLPVQYEFKPLKQEISYELGTDKLIIKNLFDEPVDDANYMLAMKYIKEKSKMEVTSAEDIASMNNKSNASENTNNAANTNNNNETPANNTTTQPTNLSNTDLVNIAFNDAKEVEDEAKELTEQANISLNIANQKSMLAQNKQREADQLLADANKMTDPAKKKQALSEANDVAIEAEQLNQETVAAFNLAKRLEINAASKQKEAELSQNYAKALENAVKAKNATEALNKADELQKQLDALNQENANQGNIVNSLKIDVNNKKTELDKAIQTSADIKQGITDNETLIKNLENDIANTKNEKIKADLENQITGLKDDNEENVKDLAFNEQRVVKLQKEYETIKNEMELVSNVVNQSKTTTNESAAASVANIDKTKLEEQVNTIKSNNNNVAVNNNQTTPNNNNTENNVAVTNNNNNSNKNNTEANKTETTNNTTETATNTSPIVDYNKNYTAELDQINSITNDAEKEKKKAELYFNWISAINADINNKKEEIKTTKDSKRKKELNTKIVALQKELKEKQKEGDIAAANAKKAEQTTAVVSNNTSENTSTENTTSETNPTPTNINQKYAEELFAAQNINNEAEREQAKATTLKQWAEAIDKDIEKKKQDMAASNDPEMKALLAAKIVDLKKQSEEKQTQANEAQNNADKLKQQQPVVTNNTTENASAETENTNVAANNNGQTNNQNNAQTTNETGNTIAANTNENKTVSETNNNVVANTNNNDNTNVELTYDQKFNNAIASANNNQSELEKEKTKQQAYTDYIAAASAESTNKKQELANTKDKKRKKELTEEIATLENDITTKQTELSAIESTIESIQEKNASIASNTEKSNSGNTPATADFTYTNTNAIQSANKAKELDKQADDLFSQAKQLEEKAGQATGTTEKENILSEVQNIKNQAETKRIESLTASSDANTSEISANKNVIEQYAAASKNKNADDVIMADMMKEEAATYIERANKSRTSAENEKSFYAKETLLNDANDNEKIALEKQRKALDIYKKNNPDLIVSNNPVNTSDNNIAVNNNNNTVTTNNPENTNNTTTETTAPANKNTNTNNQNATNETAVVTNNNNSNESPANPNNTNTSSQTNTTKNTASVTNNTATQAPSTENTPSNSNIKSSVVLAPEEKFERTTQPVYTASRPIPVNEKMPEGLIFKVQIGAFRNPIPPETFSGMSPLTAETTAQGLTRYTAGLFTKFATADKVKDEIRAIGYKDAFVVAFLNGKRIPINQAMEMLGLPPVVASNNTANTQNNTTNTATENTNNNSNTNSTNIAAVNNNTNTNQQPVNTQSVTSVSGLFYTVQIGVFAQQVNADKLFGIQPLYTELAPNGYTRYNTGVYNNIPRATEAKNIVVNAGVKDAFIVAYFNGKRISPSEAQQLIAENKATYSNAPNMNELPTVGRKGGNTTTLPANGNTNTPVNTTSGQQNTNTGNTPSNTEGNNTTTNTTVPATTIPPNNSLPVEDGIVFRVQIGAFREEVPLEVANKFLKIAKKGIKNYKDANGLTIYSVGSYKTYEEATAAKTEVVSESGITDAFIVAYNNGQKISVEEAKELLKK